MATNTIKSTTSLKYYLCSVSVIHEAKHFTNNNNNTSQSAFTNIQCAYPYVYKMSELLRFCTFFINHNFYSEFISTRNTERTESHVILFRSFCRFFLLFFTHVCMPWYVVFMFNFWMLLLNNVNNDTQTRIIYITSAVFFFFLISKNYQDSRL